jgi:hypothetical protein
VDTLYPHNSKKFAYAKRYGHGDDAAEYHSNDGDCFVGSSGLGTQDAGDDKYKEDRHKGNRDPYRGGRQHYYDKRYDSAAKK